jgi:hypothetical protein
MFKKATSAVTVCAMALALIGCGGAQLDREVEIGKMNFKAPSSYIEDGEADYLSFTDSKDDTQFFFVRLNSNPSATIEDIKDSTIEAYQPLYGFIANEKQLDVIDGHECIVVECSWPDNHDGIKPPLTFAYMSGSEGVYSILCQNESITAEDIVKTASFD